MTALLRTKLPIPKDVKDTLVESGVWDEYMARPPYQRNDYIAWILRAKRAETRQKRITQMIQELTKGGVYMGMAHTSSRKK
jgi:uncharacterized protein YdeI (YjbR/CyaY-like superfamily)